MINAKAIFKYTGAVCIPIYVFLAFISRSYNNEIDPLNNWLSDLGNYVKNPSGALIYNLGCVIAAVLLAVFYIGIYQWYGDRKNRRKYVISYIGAQISVITACSFLYKTS